MHHIRVQVQPVMSLYMSCNFVMVDRSKCSTKLVRLVRTVPLEVWRVQTQYVQFI